MSRVLPAADVPCSSLYVALVHYPVLNRTGDVIASAITNLDLHDLARLARTFGISRCYIVTPLKDQQTLAERLLHHWIEGIGRELHRDRELALRHLLVVDSIGAAKNDIALRSGKMPKVWVTTAKSQDGRLSITQARKLLHENSAVYLLALGTGWGLAPVALTEADAVLQPIQGHDGYNHLSVRCAAAILLDRLLHREI